LVISGIPLPRDLHRFFTEERGGETGLAWPAVIHALSENAVREAVDPMAYELAGGG
jgi:hypothetical protein